MTFRFYHHQGRNLNPCLSLGRFQKLAVLGELKGLANTFPNPAILLNAVVLKETSARSEIENIIATQDKL